MVGALDDDRSGMGNQRNGAEVLGTPDVAVDDEVGIAVARCGDDMKS